MGTYTGIDILLGSHLSPHAVQTKLNPRLGSFLGVFEEELEFGMKNDFPDVGGKLISRPILSILCMSLTHAQRSG